MTTHAAQRKPDKGQELDLRVESLAFGGNGVARVPLGERSYVVFVRDAVPGDLVRAVITKRKRDYAEARTLEVLEPGPDRIPATAGHPGAPWQVLPYERQLAVKAEQVEDALRRLGRLDGFEIEPIVAADEQWRYRNKLEYSFGRGEDGELVCGFHAPGSWERIEHVEDCLLASERGNEIRRRVLEVFRADGAVPYDRRAQTGFLRNLVVREGRRTGQFQVRVVTSPGALDAQPLIDALTGVDSLIWTQAAGVAETTQGGRDELLAGVPRIEEELCGLRFALSSEAFFQTNTEMAERLYGVAQEYAALSGWERVFDLCCGIGTIGLTLAPRAADVLGVEIVEGAVEDAQANARANEIANARFIAGDVRPVLKELIEQRERPDVDRRRPAARRAVAQGRGPHRRVRAEADRLRLLQPDDARAERRAARRGRLPAGARAAGRHVPADAAHRVRGAARAGVSGCAEQLIGHRDAALAHPLLDRRR